MGENADDRKSLSWQARILLEIADTLLDSTDITQALAQIQTDASVLRDLVVANFDFLLTSSATPMLSFEQRVEPEVIFLSHRSLRLTSITVFMWLAALLASVSIYHSLAYMITGGILLLGTITGIAVAARILLSRRKFVPVGTTRDDLRREVVGPFLRSQINNYLAQQAHSDVMRITSAPGLADLSDREQLVITVAMKETLQLSASMSSGSIGVSGPRGVGKTTLLRYFCDPALSVIAPASAGFRGFADLRILISTPVEYTTKDFVLHLFGKLCETIIGGGPGLNQNASYMRKEKRRRRLVRLLGACILIGCGLGLIAYALIKPKHMPQVTRPELYLCAGALSLAVGLWILIRWSWSVWSTRRTSTKTASITDEARAWLTRINYLQTVTSGYSGTLKIPAGLGVEVTSGRQLSELELTLPDLIDRYKSFAARAIRSRQPNGSQLQVTRESRERYAQMMENRAALFHRISESWMKVPVVSLLAGLPRMLDDKASTHADVARQTLAAVPRRNAINDGPRILIGIDEVDKIDADSAQRFLNDIKVIFGIPDCLYLVSISDEALTVFEQRVLLGRTAFDSSFDEVVRVDELDFESCKYLLRRRIAGMPDSLIAFCEIMSGGLPRDLIRTARSVVETSSGQTKIRDLAISVVSGQVKVLRRAFIREISSEIYKDLASRFPESLFENDWSAKSAQSILAALEGMADAALPVPFAAALYFYATVTDVFGGEVEAGRKLFYGSYRPADAVWIDRLAQARNMISANGSIAWESISSFRVDYGLNEVAKPLQTPQTPAPRRKVKGAQ